MCSRCRIELLILLLGALAGCQQAKAPTTPAAAAPETANLLRTSPLVPGLDHPELSRDPRAAAYYDNPQAVADGKRLFQQFNCSGCHSNGGGGMGPALMDGQWIYGARLEQIHQTLVEGRPNGMPSWGGKIPDPQLWELAAYVRSMSLPQTLAAQNGPTPSQTPAPVPRAVDEDAGWSAPPDTTNDYGSTLPGPQ
ncbi:MAG: c-type cytochrome [Gammaproteobacteria bacterium]|nr:c-type cytochrome [Gammaproteobacteria bacterium]MBV9696452.1 c-type cytochrome [Gammaproteobacteria bacterium]